MNELKKRKEIKGRILFIITVLFLLISVVCLTINYFVNRSINWSLFPIGALILIWATILPLLIMEKNKAFGLFVGLTITLIPFLFLIQNQVAVKGWVTPLALPIAGLSLLAFGISLISFAYIKSNRFYPVAITVFLFGVIINFCIGIIVNRFLNENNIVDISRVSTICGSAVLSFILIVMGYNKRNKTNVQHESLH